MSVPAASGAEGSVGGEQHRPRPASVADCLALVGRELGPSESVRVDQAIVDKFADATRDHQWIHVDTERAAQSRFGGTIVHGYLILSLGPWLVRQLMDLSAVRMSINYGLDRTRFISPVRVGEALQLRVNVTDVRAVSDEVARLHMRYTFERTSPVEPVCAAEVISQLQFAGSDVG